MPHQACHFRRSARALRLLLGRGPGAAQYRAKLLVPAAFPLLGARRHSQSQQRKPKAPLTGPALTQTGRWRDWRCDLGPIPEAVLGDIRSGAGERCISRSVPRARQTPSLRLLARLLADAQPRRTSGWRPGAEGRRPCRTTRHSAGPASRRGGTGTSWPTTTSAPIAISGSSTGDVKTPSTGIRPYREVALRQLPGRDLANPAAGTTATDWPVRLLAKRTLSRNQPRHFGSARPLGPPPETCLGVATRTRHRIRSHGRSQAINLFLS